MLDQRLAKLSFFLLCEYIFLFEPDQAPVVVSTINLADLAMRPCNADNSDVPTHAMPLSREHVLAPQSTSGSPRIRSADVFRQQLERYVPLKDVARQHTRLRNT